MIYMQNLEIDNTQNSQMYIHYTTNIAHKYNMYYTLITIPLYVKGNYSQLQMDKSNGLYFHKF